MGLDKVEKRSVQGVAIFAGMDMPSALSMGKWAVVARSMRVKEIAEVDNVSQASGLGRALTKAYGKKCWCCAKINGHGYYVQRLK